MEDFKLILYILAAIAFFLYNTWRKAFKDNEDANPPDELPKRKPDAVPPRQEQPRPQPRPLPQSQPRPQPQQTARPVMPKASFEDILRELQPKAERAQEQARPVVERAKEIVREPVAAAPGQREARSYERAAEVALSLENPEEAREAQRRAQRRQIVNHEAFAAYKSTVAKTNRYADMLRTPQGARDAFVLSEIFKRKYE